MLQLKTCLQRIFKHIVKYLWQNSKWKNKIRIIVYSIIQIL